jgi:restriction system protein
VNSSNDLAETVVSEVYALQMVERDVDGSSVATILGGPTPAAFGVDKSGWHLAQPVFPEPLTIAVRQFATELCRLVAEDPDALRRIEWRDVERLLAAALTDIGFRVELTSPSKDGGKDIVARCAIRNEDQTFYIEVKHWKKKRVGDKDVRKFVQVNIADRTNGGLFLSTSGYAGTVYQHRAEITRDVVRLGNRSSMVSLAQHAVRARSGLWLQHPLPETLFEQSI